MLYILFQWGVHGIFFWKTAAYTQIFTLALITATLCAVTCKISNIQQLVFNTFKAAAVFKPKIQRETGVFVNLYYAIAKEFID